MRQISTLKKVNSHLCVIDTLKFRTCYLIMRHKITRSLVRALGIHTCDCRYVRTRCHIQKVPQLPKWPLLQLTTSIYIGSSTAYMVTMYTSGSGKYPTIGEILGTARERDNTHDRYAVAVLEADTCCVAIFPFFTHAMATINCGFCDMPSLCVTNPNYASSCACRILIYARVTLQK